MLKLVNKFWYISLAVIFIAGLYFFNSINVSVDLTEEKKFSIQPATKSLLQNLNQTVEIEVLLDGNLSSGFKKLQIATKDLLENYRSLSNGLLTFTFSKPGDGASDSTKAYIYDSLAAMGIKPVNNQLDREDGEKTEQVIFPAAIVKCNNKAIAIDLMSGKSGQDEESSLNYSEALLEFKFDDAIDKLTRSNYPVVALAMGNGEPLNPTIVDLTNMLRTNYRLALFDLKNGMLNADTVKTLVIVKPQLTFSEIDKVKIDQYIMQGGKVVWLIDKLYAEFDSLIRAKSDFVAFDKNLQIDDLLFRYGVRINPDLLQDLNCAKQPLVVGNSGGQPQIQRIPFPYYPLLSSSKKSHPISKNLDHVLSIFPSSIDTVKADGITKTVLLATDTNSRTLSTPAIVSLQSIKTENDFNTFTKSNVPVAVLLEGNFQSLYANRFTPQMKDSVAKFTGINFLEKGIKPSQQIVISDADLVTNVVTESGKALPMGTQQFEEYTFANRDFFINCMDYLVGNAAIISTRNKDFTLRLLDKNKVKEEKSFWQLINIALPILLIGIFVFAFTWYRRNNFGR
jgi:ABC-2 type transport system permease protein